MQVVEKTYSGYSLINLESWLLSENRVIFIDDNINSESAELFKRQMMYLLSKSETEPIEIQINSIYNERNQVDERSEDVSSHSTI